MLHDAEWARPADWERDLANAQFIVRACNSHNDLLEACKAVVRMGSHSPFDAASMMAKAAITKAERVTP
jgi:hypothetical protein